MRRTSQDSLIAPSSGAKNHTYPSGPSYAQTTTDPFRDEENEELRYLPEDDVNDEDLVRYWRSGYEL